ncbi:MAG: hypothetical protein ABIH49_02630 [archaeon]
MKKEIIFCMVFLIGISLINFVLAYSVPNPQLTSPANSFSYLGGQDEGFSFNENMCASGQDFIIQVAPFGCTPAVVRSDLLEEQNVPVFCQLYATQINPLIDVKAIDYISFSGQYPDDVAGIGFHPAQAALKSSSANLLNSPVLENIGYAVIVLKQNKNESSMPDFVKGNLTASIRYNIENAFGVGKAVYYIPELNTEDWNSQFEKYGFYGGRGFLRADAVDTDNAIVSVYADKTNRIATFNLQRGQTSSEFPFPGFYCGAGLRLRLDGVVNPDTRAKFDVNGEIYEIAKGEKFLDNKCQIEGNMVNQGLNQEVRILCRTDNGAERFTLSSAPAVRLNVTSGGVTEVREIKVGDKLYESSDAGRWVYVAYIGTGEDSGNKEDLFIAFVSMPLEKERLSASEIERFSSIAKQLGPAELPQTLLDIPVDALNAIAGLANYFRERIFEGNKFGGVLYGYDANIGGRNLKIDGFSGFIDEEIDSSDFVDNSESANADYDRIIGSFPTEKEKADDVETFGQRALFEKVRIAFLSGQKKTLSGLCDEFAQRYPLAKSQVSQYCDEVKLSNSESSVENVVINGQVKSISFEGISEPTLDDYSAEILIRNPEGEVDSYTFRKNDLLYLGDVGESAESEIFVYSYSIPTIYSVTAYFKYESSKQVWQWTSDKENWVDVSAEVSSGAANENVREIITGLRNKDFGEGKEILLSRGAETESGVESSNEFIQLISLDDNNARIKFNFEGLGKEEIINNEGVLEKGISESFGGNYVFTLNKINLKRVAKVSVVPRINNAGTEANFSFEVGIEKRAIQLSPDKIKEKINSLNETINKWQSASDKLGNVVKGFNAACISVGATLTIKNLFENFDGRAIARQEVMRSSGGWFDICEDEIAASEEKDTIDSCLLKHSDEIERDVDVVENIIKEQEGITKDNLNGKLTEIRDNLANVSEGNIANPFDENEVIPVVQGSDVYAAFTPDGYASGRISLTQLKDIERLNEILASSSTSSELKGIAERKLYNIVSNVNKNSEQYSERLNLVNKYGVSSEQIGFLEVGKDIKQIPYRGLTYGNDVKSKTNIAGVEDQTPIAFLQTSLGEFYVILLDDSTGTNILPVKTNEANEYLIYNENGELVADLPNELRGGVYYRRFDAMSYQNKFRNPEVRYFETAPYKGLPAVVPFDTNNGWYVNMKQTISGFGNIRAYDDSGRIVSFYLCNVGENGRAEFNSQLNDDICMNFNPGTGVLNGEFPGLDETQTNLLVQRAMNAVQQAANQHGSALKNVNIFGETIPVGNPANEILDIQCQDLMSPEECLLLFNTCDPVVCPSSRCDLGGTYHVDNVIQSGVVGSVAMCLPNVKEGIVVPVCLSGVKAGVDSLISLQENYRDCLQDNLDTGETIGVCDEIHSIYLCDLFWSQALPFSQVIIPKAFEAVTGQTGRGGGEYLGVQSAWENAGKSVDYMTQYYGAASIEAFKTGVVKQIGNEVCRNFVSASYPTDVDLFGNLVEPQSPVQFHAWFSEKLFTSATVPPTSQYGVFYHIFAGDNQGAYYSVYLKSPVGSSFYQSNPTIAVSSGYIPKGESATEKKDFTAPPNYQELCIKVNGQEECGFEKVTTDFALNYLNDLYLQEQAGNVEIKTESECVSGTPSVYSFINPNLQAGVEDAINPALYREQIVRVCSTDNPGKGTDPLAGTQDGRWIEVGKCNNDGTLKCYLDTKSVERVIKSTTIENETLGDVKDNYVSSLAEENQYIQDFADEINKIDDLSSEEKVNYINDNLLQRAAYNNQKAELLFLRGNAFRDLALKAIGIVIEEVKKTTETATADDEIADNAGIETQQNQQETVSVPREEWDLDSAIQEIQDKRGSYSENQQFIDELCEDGVLNPNECEDINGTGFWNLEEDMNFVKKLLQEKKLGEENAQASPGSVEPGSIR